MQFVKERPVPLVCALTLGAIFLCNFVINDAENILGLVPVNSLIAKSYFWNFVTSSFYEKALFKIMMDFALLCSLQPFKIDSMEQFLLYVAFVILGSALGTSAHSFFRFFITRIEDVLVLPSFGFGGVFVCLLMYSRQQYRNQPVFSSFPLLTHDNYPVLFCLAQLILWITGLRLFTHDIYFSFLSLILSWTYLRLFYKYESVTSDHLGDHSDEFCFVNMFPDALRPITIPFTTAFYNIFALSGIFPIIELQSEKNRKLQQSQHHLRYHNPGHQMEQGHATRVEEPPLPVDEVQERRKAKAMKILDAKLAELSKESDGWDVKDSDMPVSPSKSMPDMTSLKV